MTTEKVTMKCLICEKDVPASPHKWCIDDATCWRSRGNYGSTVFDPIDGNVYLEAIICDSCLKEKKSFIQEVRTKTTTEVIERKEPDFSP
jgi:hypothetical protein